ncbi:two-component system response regulator NarL [Nitrincola nitratireducens]|uniref:Nitrate/nitrite response regulator protein narL n=1 Tax=Nitrincola nitratireducens TaxID=1229521 RepID=W9UXU9_9GAMM|nr:two-component system response regulator NarL [Nitrincola nitratireducens]EXJ09551.1 Nitrate/nitrite response regulator protein narL [Nitrincola nitratireducens]
MSSIQYSNESPASILLIDDHPLLRRGIKQLLELEEDMLVVGEASHAEEGIQKALDLDPDLILLDLNMPDINGIETLKMLRAKDITARILIFTVSDHEEDVVSALKSGADGYLLKDMEPEDLITHLRQAAHGKMVVSERLTALLAEALRNQRNRPSGPDVSSLTARELQILRLIAEGLSNKMIARRLDVTEGTVKVHVKNLLKKMHFRSRVEVAVWAVQEGMNR